MSLLLWVRIVIVEAYVRAGDAWGAGSLDRGQALVPDRVIKTQQRESLCPSLHLGNWTHQHELSTTALLKMAPIEIKSVLISESVDPRCRTILEENGIRVTEKQNMKKDELIAEIKASVTA